MTREEKCKTAIEKGYTYNPETGNVYGPYNKELTRIKRGYLTFNIKLNKKNYNIKHHQFAWYCINKETVDCLDHINGIKTDNRIINLRSVTQQENLFNNSKAKGYSWDKISNKWRTKIKINEKNIHLGYFENENDARQAYLKAKEFYHIIK